MTCIEMTLSHPSGTMRCRGTPHPLGKWQVRDVLKYSLETMGKIKSFQACRWVKHLLSDSGEISAGTYLEEKVSRVYSTVTSKRV